MQCVYICRQGFEECLAEELRAASCEPEAKTGMVVAAGHPAKEPLIFERQRLEDPLVLEAATLKPLAREVAIRLLPAISGSAAAWTVHAFASNPDSPGDLSRRAASLEAVFLELCRQRFPAVHRRQVAPRELPRGGDSLVLQLCLTPEGACLACVTPAARLTDPFPGGAHRMPFDSQSPSRSYLKIEEALDLMGEQPRRGQSVVDLGAAPGGWTYAFVKRGCRVTAVDNGPLRLQSLGKAGGTVRHLRQDGIAYQPPPDQRPVDWLVSDMLVTAGKNIGMLRKWVDGRWMKRFVFNVKLPQAQPLAALAPLRSFLEEQTGAEFQIRQLYHDRREVTVFGRLR